MRPVRTARFLLLVGLFVVSFFCSQAWSQYTWRTSAEAQASADRHVQSIRDVVEKFKEHDRKIKSLGSIDDLNRQLNDLIRERDRTLDDLRNGRFCSKCNRSATEIERAGEGFLAHVRNVGGVVVAASQQVIDQKMQEYQQKISALERRKAAWRHAAAEFESFMNKSLDHTQSLFRSYESARNAHFRLAAEEAKRQLHTESETARKEFERRKQEHDRLATANRNRSYSSTDEAAQARLEEQQAAVGLQSQQQVAEYKQHRYLHVAHHGYGGLLGLRDQPAAPGRDTDQQAARWHNDIVGARGPAVTGDLAPKPVPFTWRQATGAALSAISQLANPYGHAIYRGVEVVNQTIDLFGSKDSAADPIQGIANDLVLGFKPGGDAQRNSAVDKALEGIGTSIFD